MRSLLILLFSTLFFYGCAESNGGGEAANSAPAAASQASLADAASGRYLLDKTHGYVTFSYSHQGYSRPWLRFRDIDATLDLDASEPANSKLQVVIDANSIDSGVDIFDEHLRDEQFFNTARHPSIEYVATAIKPQAKTGHYKVEGVLTMKGVARPLVLNAVFNKSGLHFQTKQPQVGFSAKASLKRSDWDLGAYAPMVGDEVDIVIEAEFMQP